MEELLQIKDPTAPAEWYLHMANLINTYSDIKELHKAWGHQHFVHKEQDETHPQVCCSYREPWRSPKHRDAKGWRSRSGP